MNLFVSHKIHHNDEDMSAVTATRTWVVVDRLSVDEVSNANLDDRLVIKDVELRQRKTTSDQHNSHHIEHRRFAAGTFVR